MIIPDILFLFSYLVTFIDIVIPRVARNLRDIMQKIKDLDLVALLEDITTIHYETGEIIKLYKGQIGTVVMEYDGTVFEVEFSNNNDETYAMETLKTEQLMLLHHDLVLSV